MCSFVFKVCTIAYENGLLGGDVIFAECANLVVEWWWSRDVGQQGVRDEIVVSL